jgi:hypothetical protein
MCYDELLIVFRAQSLGRQRAAIDTAMTLGDEASWLLARHEHEMRGISRIDRMK